MSYELEIESPSGVLSSIKDTIAAWFRKERPKYAHPWTAYSPANFKPCEITKSTASTPKVQQQAVISPIRTEPVDDGNIAFELIQSLTQEDLPETRKSEDVTETSEPITKPAILRLVSSNELSETQTSKPVMPGLAACTGRDFKLAARLASVSAQNRKSAPASAPRMAQGTGTNRPIKQPVRAKRMLSIQPPAVGRKVRTSAKVVQLRLARKRAERAQAKALKIA